MYYNHPKKFSNTDSRCDEFATHNNSSKQVSSCLKIDFHIIDLPSALAGRLTHFLPNWQLISSNPDVLAAVVGYKLELTETPTQTYLPPVLHFSQADTAKIDAEIQNLNQKGALKRVPPDPNQFISNLFLVPK